jgi:hypothetical protein
MLSASLHSLSWIRCRVLPCRARPGVGCKLGPCSRLERGPAPPPYNRYLLLIAKRLSGAPLPPDSQKISAFFPTLDHRSGVSTSFRVKSVCELLVSLTSVCIYDVRLERRLPPLERTQIEHCPRSPRVARRADQGSLSKYDRCPETNAFGVIPWEARHQAASCMRVRIVCARSCAHPPEGWESNERRFGRLLSIAEKIEGPSSRGGLADASDNRRVHRR